jgi:triosephosphate isomerase
MSGAALSICAEQIVAKRSQWHGRFALAIGYEPLWAIGSWKMPTSQERRDRTVEGDETPEKAG